MGALPPVFVEFVALTGAFKTATKGVTREIQAVERAGGGAFSKAGAVGKLAFLGIAGAATVAAAKSIGMATNFQAEMNLIYTAAGESTTRMKQLNDGVMAIARNTGVSTDQLAKGLYIVEKAGIRGADALKVTKAAAQASVAEGVDLQTMTTALTSVMQTYGVKAKDVVGTQNQIIVAAGESKTTMAQFAGSLSTVLPKAKAAGLSFADAAAALGTLTQHGTTADQAAQDLQNTIVNLASPSRIAVNAMQQMGVNVIDLQKNLGKRGLAGTMEYLTGVVSKHMGKDGLIFVDAFKKSKSAAEDMVTMLDKMPPSLAKLSKGFLDGKVSMKDYRTGIRDMGSEGYAKGAQFLALSSQVNGFNDLLKSGTPQARTFSGALKQMVGGTTALNTYLMLTGKDNMPGFLQRTRDITAASKNAGTNIMRWSEVSGTLRNRFQRLHQIIDTTMITIGLKLIPVVERAMDWLGVRLTTALRNVHQWFDRNRTTIDAVAHVLESVLKVAFEAVMTSIRALSDLLQGVLHFFEKHKAIAVGLATAVGVLTAAWIAQQIALKLVYAATFIYARAQALLNVVMDANPIMLVVAAIAGLTVGLIYAYKHSARFRQIVADVGNALKAVWTHVLQPVVQFFQTHWKTALEIAVAVFAPFIALPMVIIQHWGAILSFFKSLPGKIKKFFVGAAKWLFNFGIDIIKGLLNGIVAEQVALFHWFSSLSGAIAKFFVRAIRWLAGAGVSLVQGLINGIRQRAVNLWAWFRGLPGDVGGFFKSAGTWLLEAGKAIVQGLIDGLHFKVSDLQNTLEDIAKMPVTIPLRILHIKSPSRLMRDLVGKPIVEGIAVGIADNGHRVHEAMTRLSRSVAGSRFGGPLVPSMAGIGGGGAGVVNVNVTVQGTVIAERDLANAVQEQMLRTGLRRGATRTYQPYKRVGGN